MKQSLPKGHLSCLSSAFRYTPAAATDVARTFARVRRGLEPAASQPAPAQAAAAPAGEHLVLQLSRRKSP